jgi:hypothetical protein
MQVFLGDLVTIIKDETFITGRIEGLKMIHGKLERIAITSIDSWFWLSDGWLFAEEETEEEDA